MTLSLLKDPVRIPKWITDKYIIVMLLVYPLFTGFAGYLTLTVSKYVFFVAATGAWLLVLAVCKLVVCMRNRAFSFHINSAQTAVCVFAAANVISWVLSDYRDYALIGGARYDGLITQLLYCGIFLGVSSYGCFDGKYVAALAMSASVCSLIAILQILGCNILGLFPGELSYYDSGVKYTGAFLGTIGNTNLLSAFYSLCIPLFLTSFIMGKGRKIIFMLPAMLSMFVLSFSGVSGGLVAIIVWSVFLFAFASKDYFSLLRLLYACAAICFSFALASAFRPVYSETGLVFEPAFGSKALLGAAGCIICLAACALLPNGFTLKRPVIFIAAAAAVCLAAVYFYPGENGTLYEFRCVLHGEVRDEFGSSRIRIWRGILNLVPEHKWFGTGPDTLVKYLDIVFSRYVEETGSTLTTRVDNAHNEYLGFLANIGILGLCSYISIMLCSAWMWMRKNKNHIALYASIVSCWVSSFFGLGLCIAAPVVWVIWALSVASGGAYERKTGEMGYEI